MLSLSLKGEAGRWDAVHKEKACLDSGYGTRESSSVGKTEVERLQILRNK
jgi:hypothetical protein